MHYLVLQNHFKSRDVAISSIWNAITKQSKSKQFPFSVPYANIIFHINFSRITFCPVCKRRMLSHTVHPLYLSEEDASSTAPHGVNSNSVRENNMNVHVNLNALAGPSNNANQKIGDELNGKSRGNQDIICSDSISQSQNKCDSVMFDGADKENDGRSFPRQNGNSIDVV